MMQNGATDRRLHMRYRTAGRGRWIAIPSGVQVEFELLDISLGGISFRVPHPIPVNTRGAMRFSVLCEGRQVTVEARGDVRNCVLEHSEYRIGVQFHELGEAAHNAMEMVIDARSRIVHGY
ncbi:uncharacterized protein E1O_02310 [Burkholderiales bacterium GJ-E10]|nr:uncharacterized protein E1O_02310 [Burkholderiales bacterium GJ-E10]